MSSLTVSWNHQSVERWIDKVTYNFVKRHGGDFAELQAEAHGTFLEVMKTHDPERAKLTTWVGRIVWQRLTRKAAEVCKHHERWRESSEGDLDGNPAKERFCLTDFLANLSEDAATVASLVCEPPPDLELDVKDRSRAGGWPSRRAALVQYLRDIGWCGERIAESFSEIAEALVD